MSEINVLAGAAGETEAIRSWARAVPELFPSGDIIAESNEQAIRRLPCPPADGPVAVKVFPPRRVSGKELPGKRSWDNAVYLREQGLGTPEPVALVEGDGEWLVTRELPAHDSFKSRLIDIYVNTHQCHELIALMQVVADAVRELHAAGMFHGDLGNQNILLLREPGEDPVVQFIDLNRARISPSLSLHARARDLSRIHLPSEFRRIFYEMYFEGEPPDEFKKAERRIRRRFAWHTWTRRWRHPIRERRRAKTSTSERYPDATDMWIWDDKSMQAITCLRSKERLTKVRPLELLRAGFFILRDFPKAWWLGRKMEREVFRSPVAMGGRLGCAVEPTEDRWQHEQPLLEALPRSPVLVRFYHHAGEGQEERSAEAIRAVAAAGFPVMVALVQCRRSVTDPASWHAFCLRVLTSVDGLVEEVEVGHASSRVKWGCWTGADYGVLGAVVPALRERFPTVLFTGPACIDFEYHRIIDALSACGRDVHFDGLSHHLYVDRRGAPENEQNGWDTVRKCALARAVARSHGKTDDRFVISEVNWPLAKTGVYSPIASPYLYPGRTKRGEDEETYADFVVRFALLTLCSGMVDRVIWWNLAAHGFGLVDDQGWRPRPAYHAFERWGRLMEGATFRSRTVFKGWWRYDFSREEGATFSIVYAHPETVVADLSFAVSVTDFFDRSVAVSSSVELSGRPLICERAEEGQVV